jgi:hypothetical protein
MAIGNWIQQPLFLSGDRDSVTDTTISWFDAGDALALVNVSVIY